MPEESITVPIGPLDVINTAITPTMCDHLRKLGMICEVLNGKLELKDNFIAAERGVPLTPEQAKALEHLKKPLATFTVTVSSHWNKAKTAFEEL